jgi:hypothetical protein
VAVHLEQLQGSFKQHFHPVHAWFDRTRLWLRVSGSKTNKPNN